MVLGFLFKKKEKEPVIPTLDVSSLDSLVKLDIPVIVEEEAKRLPEQEDYGNDIYLSEENSFKPFPPNATWAPKPSRYFNKEGEEIINNLTAFSEITNLADILVQMTKVMHDSITKDVAISYIHNFSFKLTDPIVPNYKGKA